MRYVMIFAMAMLLIAGIWGSALAQTGDELIPIYEATVEAFNAHDAEQMVIGLRTEDTVLDYVPLPSPMTNREDIIGFYAYLFSAPETDIHLAVQRVLTSGNILVSEVLITGTHTVEWAGIPPTGKEFSLPHLAIYEYEGDKIKKETVYMDNVTLFVQVGAMPVSELPPLVPSFTLPDPEPTGLAPLAALEEYNTIWNTLDLSVIQKRFHMDAEIFAAPLGITMDRGGWAAVGEIYFAGFPDIHVEATRVVDMGDGWVLAEETFGGTHNGPYLGVPATGRYGETRTVYLYRFDADGLITYTGAYWDQIPTLITIGVMPPPEPSTVSPASWGEIKAKLHR